MALNSYSPLAWKDYVASEDSSEERRFKFEIADWANQAQLSINSLSAAPSGGGGGDMLKGTYDTRQ